MTQPDHESAIAGAAYTRHRRIHRSSSHPRPRVLQLLATGGNGGAQESYTGLLLGLDRSRYEVRALSLSAGSAVQRLRALGVPVEVLDATDDEVAVRELAAWLRREEIDLVHSHMFRAEVIGTRAAVAAGTPVIVATVHSSRVRSAEDIRLLASLTPSMDRLIVPSEASRHKVRAEGREGAGFAVIPNGIDLSRFAAPARPCALRGEFGIPPVGAADRGGRAARAGEGSAVPDRGDAGDPSRGAGGLAGGGRRGLGGRCAPGPGSVARAGVAERSSSRGAARTYPP